MLTKTPLRLPKESQKQEVNEFPKRSRDYAIGCEDYYDDCNGTALFTAQDHHRLAALLNATSALVAVSYYEHPLVAELYPAASWRRMTWTQAKALERTRDRRQYGREMLLMNYPQALSLWEAAQ